MHTWTLLFLLDATSGPQSRHPPSSSHTRILRRAQNAVNTMKLRHVGARDAALLGAAKEHVRRASNPHPRVIRMECVNPSTGQDPRHVPLSLSRRAAMGALALGAASLPCRDGELPRLFAVLILVLVRPQPTLDGNPPFRAFTTNRERPSPQYKPRRYKLSMGQSYLMCHGQCF